jgi:nucleotide-binding universal stress UspA family protein
MTKVMVPLDGSALAERAVPYAAALVRAAGGRLLLVRAVLSYFVEQDGIEETVLIHPQARTDIEAAAVRARAFGLPVEAHLVGGIGAATTLVAAAERLGADIIVMSSHGRSGLGRFLYGSVADDVLRHARVPVLLLPAANRTGWPTAGKLRVLVPLDGSALAERAIEPVLALARSMPTEVVLVHVVAPPGAEGAQLGFPPTYALPYVPDPDDPLADAHAHLAVVADRIAGDAAVVAVRVEVGYPAATIAEVARVEGAHLIVMSTHGRGGLTRAVMGSVATGVLQHATAPLLLVPAAARAAIRLSADPALPVGRTGTGSTTVSLDQNELALTLYGLELLLHSGERDPAVTEPVRALIGRLTATASTSAPATVVAG